MTKNRSLAAKMFGGLCVLLAVPALSLAQPKPENGGGNGGGGPPAGGGPGGGRGMMGGGDVQQVTRELNMTEDQQTKMREAMQSAMKDMPSREDMQDMTPEERQDAMKKMATGMRTKVLAILTPEQKEKYATTALKVANTRLDNMSKAVDKLESGDDQKKEIKTAIEGVSKSYEALKPDAEAAKDDAAINTFSEKMQKTQQEGMTKIREAAGDDFRTLMQAGMPGGGRRGGGNGGGNGGRQAKPNL